MKGNKSCIQCLLQQKVPLNEVDVMEQTALHWAVLKEQQECAVMLVKAGADVTVVNGDGQTPIDCASEEMKKLLTSYSQIAESGPRDPKQCTAELFQLLSGPAPENLHSRVKDLLEEGAEMDAVDEHESTLVCAASIQGSYEVVKVLIQHGCDLATPDSSGQTPLHWAAIKGHCSVGQLLIDSKADVNASDTAFRTPLHWAILQGHKEFVRALMRAGADQHLADEDGQTPNDLAGSEMMEIIEEGLKNPSRRNSNADIVRIRKPKNNTGDQPLTNETEENKPTQEIE